MRLLLIVFLSYFFNKSFSQVALIKDINHQPEGSYPSNFFTYGDKVFFFAVEESISDCDLWIFDTSIDSTYKASIEVNQTVSNLVYFRQAQFLIFPKQYDSLKVYDLMTGEFWVIAGAYSSLYQASDKLFSFDYNSKAIYEFIVGKAYCEKSLVYSFKEDEIFDISNKNILWNGLNYLFYVKISDYNNYRFYQISSNELNPKPFYTTDFDVDGIIFLTGDVRLLGDKALFWSIGSNGTNYLWLTDGTNNGTKKIFDFNVTGYSEKVQSELFLGNDYYFQFARNMYKTDGTIDGTVLIDNGVRTSYLGLKPLKDFLILNSEILYSKGFDTGITLFKYNTQTGIKEVVKSGFSNNFNFFSMIQNNLYFLTNGNELWVTDGSDTGTNKLTSLDEAFLRSLNITSNLFTYTPDSTHIVFKGLDNEPQIISLSDSSISTLKEINADTKNGRLASGFQFQDAYKGNVLFNANDGISGSEFWQYNRTENEINRLFETIQGEIGISLIDLLVTDSAFYFIGSFNSIDYGIYKSQGTIESTVKIANYRRETSADGRNLLLAADNLFYFYNGSDLYVSNGTTEGTILLLSSIGTPYETFISGNAIIVRTSLLEQYISDGTYTGTKRIEKRMDGLVSGFFAIQDSFYAVNYYYVFGDLEHNVGIEILRLTSTNEGYKWISAVKLQPYFYASNLFEAKPIPFKSEVIIPVNAKFGSSEGYDFWVFDGFHLSKLGRFAVNSLSTIQKLKASTLLYFTTKLSNTKFELWRSDGTENGTYKLLDFTKRILGRQWYFEHNRRLYFSADTEIYGSEIWVTDGTVGGTKLSYDLMPGKTSSYASGFVLMGNWAFFSAYSPGVGYEFHRLDLGCDGLLYSIQSGNWHDESTWSCGKVPQFSDYVIIKTGHKVVQFEGTSTSFGGLLSEPGAVMEVRSGSVFTSNSSNE